MSKMDTAPTIIQGPTKVYRYGWFGFTPSCLQTLNKAIWFLVFICIANLFQSMTITGLIGGVLSSLETRFGFTSTQSSWIVISYDVSTIPILVILSYFGSGSHRPRWTSAGLFVLVVGTTLFILPHFTTPAYNPGASVDEDPGLCLARNGSDTGGKGGAQAGYTGYLVVFILARILHGLGAVPLYTIAVTYMDDMVTKGDFSLYIAFIYATGILGPALGYIVGGLMLTIFTDFDTVDTEAIGIDSNSRNWVGAWWLGFLVGALAIILVCIPLSGYPRDLPGATEIRANKVSEAYNSRNDEEDYGAGDGEINVGLKELPQYLKDLLFNPTYVFLTLMVCCDSFLLGGFSAFGPKYFQEQFAVSAAVSGMMFGIVVIPGGAGGTIAGGIIVKKLGLKCAGIMKAQIILSVTIMVAALMFFITCDPISFVGVTKGYGDSDAPKTANFDAECNMNCSCDKVDFAPICSEGNYQYYSPCHAGCTGMDSDDTTANYYNCSCITATENITNLFESAASTKHCSVEGCNLAPLFVAIFCTVALFCLFSCSSMNIIATVRCLPSSHRSIGIGIQSIFLRLLGAVPGPPAFGSAFDQACLVFSYNEQGERQQCLFYDKEKMAYLLLAICVAIKVASILFIILAWKLYKPPQESDQSEVTVEPSVKSNDPPLNDTETEVNRTGVTNAAFDLEIRPVTNEGLYPALDNKVDYGLSAHESLTTSL